MVNKRLIKQQRVKTIQTNLTVKLKASNDLKSNHKNKYNKTSYQDPSEKESTLN